MIDAILALWIGFEAYRRKFWWVIPVSVLVLLYEAADVGWIRVSKWITMEGTIKKLILFILIIFMFLAWRKKQVWISSLILSAVSFGVCLVRSPVTGSFLEALQQPEADYLGLAARWLATGLVFNALTGLLLIGMLVLILLAVLEQPVVPRKRANC